MDLIYWLLLLKAPHLGVRTFYKALKVFETPEQIFLASKTKRKECGLFRQVTLDYLAQYDVSVVRADLDWAKAEVLTLVDEGYP